MDEVRGEAKDAAGLQLETSFHAQLARLKMSFPKRRLIGDSDCMSWNCPVLGNSAGRLVGESLSLGRWQGLEGLPVGVPVQTAGSALEPI